MGVKLETRKPITVAYIEHIGNYDSILFEKYIRRLYGWVKEKKVMPGFHPLAIYCDSPEKTPPGKCRSEIAIPIYRSVKPEAEIKIKKLPRMKVATLSHKGPSKEYPNSYKRLDEWITKNGYEWAGPAIEVYSKKPEVVAGGTIIHAKILVRVKKRIKPSRP